MRHVVLLCGALSLLASPVRPVTVQRVAGVVPATDCSGRGAWRAFTSKSWPVSFDYPASWRISDPGDYLLLECPDPATLDVGESRIVFQRAAESAVTRARDGRRGKRVGRFVTFDNARWYVGETCEDDDAPGETSVFCRIARQSNWRGMTVLQGAAGEDRHYGPEGYVGQGGGIISYLFMNGRQSVSIDSHDTPSFFDTLGSAGPVLFDGNGVIERLIRSIRRR